MFVDLTLKTPASLPCSSTSYVPTYTNGKRSHRTPDRSTDADTRRQKARRLNLIIKRLDHHTNAAQINRFSTWDPHQNITFNDVKQAATDTETTKI